jgi:type IV secretion system protein VirD4
MLLRPPSAGDSMSALRAIYEFVARLDAEIEYWKSTAQLEEAVFGREPDEQRRFSAKISVKTNLRDRASALIDSLEAIARRDVRLPDTSLKARLEFFERQAASRAAPGRRRRIGDLSVDETLYEDLAETFILQYTRFILEVSRRPVQDNRINSSRTTDARTPGAAESDDPATDAQQASQPDSSLEGIGARALMPYKEIATHGDGLFIGWTEQKLDDDADDYLKQKYEDGTYKPGRNSFYYSIAHDNEGHCLTIAPTGSGKGVGVIIPNLLYYKGSIIVIDPKGENYHVTARFRRELGQRVVLLDPFDEITSAASQADRGSLNPFDFMSADPEKGEEEAQMIAEVLSGGATHRDAYWDQSAKGLLAALVNHIATSPTIPSYRRNFGTLLELIYDSDLWRNTNPKGELAEPRRFLILEKLLSDFARKHIDSVVTLAAETRRSVIGTARNYLTLFSGQNVIESMNSSSLSQREIVDDDANGFTVYLVIPPAKLGSHAKLLSLWISALMGAMMTRKKPVKRRTLFLLDECAQLGSMAQLRSAVTLLRGYGLQTWMFFQDLSQLRLLYPADSDTIVHNCAVVQTFGHSRPTAVDDLSRVVSGCTTDDLLALSREQQVVSMGGSRALTCYRANYRTDPVFSGRFDLNPRFPKPDDPNDPLALAGGRPSAGTSGRP